MLFSLPSVSALLADSFQLIVVIIVKSSWKTISFKNLIKLIWEIEIINYLFFIKIDSAIE